MLNRQRQVVYARRRALLLGSDDEVDAVLAEVAATNPPVAEVSAARAAELGSDRWRALARRLILQVTDALWVEHLELMQYTRSSVNLRAYGQRDPLIEYRKEANRLFREMQEALAHRLAELIPTVAEEALRREEAEARRIAAAAVAAGSEGGAPSRPAPARVEKIGRNDLVRITNGSETQELKYKRAEPLIASGEWTLVR